MTRVHNFTAIAMDTDLESLTALIKNTLAQHPSGVTEADMHGKGFRLITNVEYREALLRKDPEISIWRPLCAEDEETTVAFAFQSKQLGYHLTTASSIPTPGILEARILHREFTSFPR